MKAEEFIEQQMSAGYKVHLSSGVWWQRVMPFYYKPVNPLQKITPGSARPGLSKLFLGYSHLVRDEAFANKRWSVMLLNREKLECFSEKSIKPSSRRSKFRKGLKLNKIARIEDIDPLISAMREICISAAVRTRHGKPPEYYVKKSREWETFMRREFALRGREWWGAFNEGKLIAYYYSYQIDGTMFISAAKSHTKYLDTCPNDALIYSFLEYCRSLKDCGEVIYGDWANEDSSLNDFKEKYGFEKFDLPVYAHYNPIVKLVRRMTG